MIHRILLRDPAAARWLAFERPVAVLVANRSEDVLPVLRDVESRVDRDGLVAAGFVSYEAAAGIDAAFETGEPGELPLVLFGLFERATEQAPPAVDAEVGEARWRFDTDSAVHAATIARIRDEIAHGNTYQVNYTIRAHADRPVDAWQLFRRVAVDMPYAAFLEADDFSIVSASPELFFRLDGEQIVSRPMKGTAPRGLDTVGDRALRDTLVHSAKDRAENVMIADMIRNDVGRIAAAGSVRTESLFAIEKYPTVWQATSTVTARTAAAVSEIFASMFPCASITGAPKVASMRLIRELETSPRGIYTGAIGWLAPGRRAQFSVAIRTATVEHAGGATTYGVGGGIVWDSDADREYAECRAKAGILERRPLARAFELFETLQYSGREGFSLLERHLARLAASADYFDFPFDRRAAVSALESAVCKLPDTAPHRVRLKLAADGSLSATATAFAGDDQALPIRVRLAALPVDSGDLRLYHKTTDRSIYAAALAAVGDCDDVLLWNADGFVTESTIANLLCRFGDSWVTPPVAHGLLPGTFRAELLERGEVVERAVRIEDLDAADELCLVNSLRGRYAIELDGAPLARLATAPV